jgi:hypothetical protein
VLQYYGLPGGKTSMDALELPEVEWLEP